MTQITMQTLQYQGMVCYILMSLGMLLTHRPVVQAGHTTAVKSIKLSMLLEHVEINRHCDTVYRYKSHQTDKNPVRSILTIMA